MLVVFLFTILVLFIVDDLCISSTQSIQYTECSLNRVITTSQDVIRRVKISGEKRIKFFHTTLRFRV